VNESIFFICKESLVCYFCLYFEYDILLILHAYKLLQKSSEIQTTALTEYSTKNSNFIQMHIKELICQYENTEEHKMYILTCISHTKDQHHSAVPYQSLCHFHIIMPWHTSDFNDFFKTIISNGFLLFYQLLSCTYYRFHIQ
jgi:hypothetical protein